MNLAFLANEEHFVDHLAPLWRATGGTFYTTQDPMLYYGRALGLPMEVPTIRQSGPSAVVVASYGDLKRSRTFLPHAKRALLQHGSGQSYPVGRHAVHPSYSGGKDHDDVSLFLCPNEYSAARWRTAYPAATVSVVGSPRVDTLPAKEPGPTTVVMSFHWDCPIAPETKSAFQHFRSVLGYKDSRYNLLVHCHPRARRWLTPYFRRYGIPYIERFDDVCRQADLYIIDNSSTLFEFAATGRPVMLMNPPWYRRNVEHGMRFWELSSIGLNVNDPRDVHGTISTALLDPPGVRAERERCVALVYPIRTGSTAEAAEAVKRWLRVVS